MLEFTAKIEIRNGKIFITPDYNYIEFDDFIWENREEKINVINVIPF
jgi:hypothetical protein